MNDPFDFDISASADKEKRKKQQRRTRSGAFDTSSQPCAHPGCPKPGKYRAPKSATQLDSYVWFCLDHVRAYNNSWNFFDNGEEDIPQGAPPQEKPKIKDHTRATQEQAWARMGFHDPYEVLRDKATSKRSVGSVRQLTTNEHRALEILGGLPEMTKAELRQIYKKFIKDLHPDQNNGSRADEERLNEIVWAWEQIKISAHFREF